MCGLMDDIRAPGVLDSPDALVALALTGDEAAFARIIRLHRTAMVRTCFVVALDRELAAEAVAAAWPIAWDRLDSLPDPARLGPWLCSIAVGEAREVVLHGSSRLDFIQTAGAPDRRERPDRAAADTDADLARRLRGLRVEDRACLALAYVGGLSPTEVAQVTGLTPTRVTALRERLGTRSSERLERRLQAFADVTVAHVNIDAVAHSAKVTRGDRRTWLASLALASIVALAVMAVPYLGESGPWPAFAAGMNSSLPWPSPSPEPTTDIDPAVIERPR
jgi:DNA-directed RNA polymerase specialized sigma24 family protein